MRSFRLWTVSAFWIALATLMPMAALKPVACAHEMLLYTVDLCSDGSANLAMGCGSTLL